MHFVDEFLATKPAKKCSGFFVRVVSFSRCFVRSFFSIDGSIVHLFLINLQNVVFIFFKKCGCIKPRFSVTFSATFSNLTPCKIENVLQSHKDQILPNRLIKEMKAHEQKEHFLYVY